MATHIHSYGMDDVEWMMMGWDGGGGGFGLGT